MEWKFCIRILETTRLIPDWLLQTCFVYSSFTVPYGSMGSARCHQDAYGHNVVAQLAGEKLWCLVCLTLWVGDILWVTQDVARSLLQVALHPSSAIKHHFASQVAIPSQQCLAWCPSPSVWGAELLQFSESGLCRKSVLVTHPVLWCVLRQPPGGHEHLRNQRHRMRTILCPLFVDIRHFG